MSHGGDYYGNGIIKQYFKYSGSAHGQGCVCTQSRQCTKTVTRHVWQDYLERAEDVRHSPLGKATYALRSQTIERVFADAKEKHAMRYTPYRGLPAVTAWVKLKFAAMNLKKLAIHKWMRLLFSAFLSYKKPDCKLAIWLL